MPRIQEYRVWWSDAAFMRLSTAKLVDGRLALDFTHVKSLSVSLGSNDYNMAILFKEFKQLEELRLHGK